MAKTCDQLAMAIWVGKYFSSLNNATLCAQIEDNWIATHSNALGDKPIRPSPVMKTYMENLDMDLEQIDSELDWDTWAWECDLQE